MVDPEQILVENLRESLRLIQRYLLLGIAVSLSLLLLQLAASSNATTDPVLIPGVVIAVDAEIAKLILVASHIAVGFMALIVTFRAKEIMEKIPRRELTEAVTTYPSIATSKEGPFRVVPALAPGLLFLFAILDWIYPQTNGSWVGWAYLGGALAMGVLPYCGLAFLLRRPIEPPKIEMERP